MSSIPFPLRFDPLDSVYSPSFSVDSESFSDSDPEDSDMDDGSFQSSLFSSCGFDLNAKPPLLDLNAEPPLLDLNVEPRFADDFDSWNFDNGNCSSYDEFPSFMEDFAPGVDSDSQEATLGGLRVVGIDSDSDSEIVDMDISDDLLDHEEQSDHPIIELESLIMATDDVEELSLSSSGISSSAGEEEESREGSNWDLEWELIVSLNNRFESMMESFMADATYILWDELLMSNDNEWSVRTPAAKMVVENLPLVDLRKEDMIVCAICKDEVEEGEMVNRLPCSHYYHTECIVPWFQIKNTCPVCRYELPTDDQD